ncbi:MAG: Xylose isomerase domain protein barrel [Thermomicrobiales bacterium]|jgi:sugar phosphate isomerase/epimerase|nr:Xylose isomerase domain protein barrel [Thermomicrobiales bacterium]
MVDLPENPIAVQLYTVRDAAREDFAGTLRQLAEGGARAVEFAGYGGMPIGELDALLDELDLRVAGAHVPLTAWEENPDAALADLVVAGGEYAVVPWLPPERRGSAAETRELAANLNRWAALAKAAGIGFAYHHHDFEFNPLPDGDGDTIFSILVSETDPTLVGIEVDVYWAARAGRDPAHLLGELQGRVPLVHLKDLGPEPDHADLPAGEGALRWDEILPAANAAGARWWVIEQDNPADPIPDALRAIRNVERMGP